MRHIYAGRLHIGMRPGDEDGIRRGKAFDRCDDTILRLQASLRELEDMHAQSPDNLKRPAIVVLSDAEEIESSLLHLGDLLRRERNGLNPAALRDLSLLAKRAGRIGRETRLLSAALDGHFAGNSFTIRASKKVKLFPALYVTITGTLAASAYALSGAMRDIAGIATAGAIITGITYAKMRYLMIKGNFAAKRLSKSVSGSSL